MITLAFYKGWKWRPLTLVQDAAIRAATFSRYSHVELIAEEAKLGDSYTCYSSSARRGGVSQARITLNPHKWDLVHLQRDAQAFRVVFSNLEGQPYDFFGALFSALPFGPVNNPNAWFCSEICHEMALSSAGTPSPGKLYKITTK